MTKKEYLAKRKILLDAAQGFVDSGKMEDYEAKVAEVKLLDEQFEQAAVAQANINALTGNVSAQANPVLSNAVATINFGGGVIDSVEEDPYATLQHRLAFANFVVSGKKMSNIDQSTTEADVLSVIPTTIMPKIIETMEATGMILPLVTRTTYASGVQVPISSVKPVATWTTEGAGSDKQKKTTGFISFSSFKLRCEISWSAEVNVSTLPIFEATFVRQVSEAMVKAIETKVISTADGTTSPKGILAETPNAGQALETKVLVYEDLVNAEAALPQAYEANAKWFMSKKTFMGFIGMTDANGQPIARVNYGLNGQPERVFLGRPTVLTGDYLPNFSSSLVAGTVFAFIFNPLDYVLNTKYDLGILRKQDWDTEDILTKAVMSVDGKVVDKGSLVTIAKKA